MRINASGFATALFATMGSPNAKDTIYVVFGRPGAGKTSVANKATEALLRTPSKDSFRPIAIDLDVCVPQWMRDNFAKGIYPTLKERAAFVSTCGNFVDDSMQKERQSSNHSGDKDATSLAVIVSFSFVNSDLRENFRKRYPDSQWILVNTSEDESKRRIEQREGHFYKGKVKRSEDEQQPLDATATSDADNKEWEFSPVTFPHTSLDGCNSIEHNANQVVRLVRRLSNADI